MSINDWQAGLEERLYNLFSIIKALPEKTSWCATRMAGCMVFRRSAWPAGGTVCGFAKAVAREREQAFVKIVDFETSLTPAVIATA